MLGVTEGRRLGVNEASGIHAKDQAGTGANPGDARMSVQVPDDHALAVSYGSVRCPTHAAEPFPVEVQHAVELPFITPCPAPRGAEHIGEWP